MSAGQDDQREPLFVGVDGGGTKTEASLARRAADGAIEILGHGSAGAANLRAVSAAAAWNQCRQAIDHAFVAAGLAPRPTAPIALAMAGGGSAPHRAAFAAEVARSSAAQRVIVTHDARPLIAAATSADCGIALIAGTGSLAYCRTAEGIEDRCGGWGYLLGDEGSGYALAMTALRAAVAAWDGRGKPTELLPALRDWIEEPNIIQWPSRLQVFSRGKIAEVARIVGDVAAAGDPVADQLLDQTASELAKHVTTLWQRRFRDSAVDVVFAGGLLVGSETIRARMLKRFITQGGRVAAQQVVPHPADTAVQFLIATTNSA